MAYAIATGLGAGLAPVAPGTVGAIEAVGIYFLTAALGLVNTDHALLLVGLNVVVFAVGVWSSNRVCRLRGVKDPGWAVVDEISGQLIALTPVALAPTLKGVIAAFVLFRLFDIFKPYPIRKLEGLAGGWGVMMDDVLAGIYSAALVLMGVYLKWL
jgi:phosphatidylglycerophosphatase A